MLSTATSLLSPEFIARLERLDLVSKKILAGRMKGDRLSKRKGQSVEFADFRNYVIGDDLRFLDWNLLARLDRLFLRLYLEEEDRSVAILLDQSLSMGIGSPSKLDYAKQIAAALGFIALNQLDRLTIDTLKDQSSLHFPTLRGRRSLTRLLARVSEMEPDGASDFNAAVKKFSHKVKGRGVVIILSDFLDKNGYETGFQHLISRQWDIYAIQILSPEEISPTLTGDLKLTDIEDGDTAEITISPTLIRRYQETLNQFRSKLSTYCLQRGIRYLFTSTEIPFDQLVFGYLRKAGMLR